MLLQQFKRQIKSLGFPDGAPYLLAVSGGLDSVVLCHLAKEAGLFCFIAHCNFSLRGEESDRDEAFVRRLGETLGMQVLVMKWDTETLAKRSRKSIQEMAREIRYNYFKQLSDLHGCSITLVAHHANDNVETMLMNFFRGTGLNGLTGIPVFTPDRSCFRPLLSFTRAELEAYAREKNLAWVEDSSNASDKYTRNFFRNQLIPELKKAFPRVEENLLANIDRFRRTQLLYEDLVGKLKQKLLTHEKDAVKIPVLMLMKYAETSLIYEIIRDYGFTEKQVEEVIKLASSDSGKFIENGEYQLIKHRNWFIITKTKLPGYSYAISGPDERVKFEQGELQFRTEKAGEKFVPDKSDLVAQLDTRSIEFPLLLRKWKQGDYFYPLGMKKKKKLARFFIDQKLPKHQKENVWVLESAKRIIWVVGMRIDDRARVTPSTNSILRICFTPTSENSRKSGQYSK